MKTQEVIPLNSFELNKINNYLLFMEGIFKAAYVLNAKMREELYQQGFLESSDPMNVNRMNTVDKPMSEKAVHQFKAEGYKVVEFNRFLQPEVSAMIKQNKINAVVCKDSKTGNLMVCYDPKESGKIRNMEAAIYDSCKNFQTDMKTLRNINATVEKAKTRTIKKLSDFQYHVLCEKLPQYEIAFVGTIVKDGAHSISFSSVDDKRVLQCVNDCARYSCTPEGIEVMKNIHREKQLFKEIEKDIKDNKTIYVASSQYGKFLKIEPNKFTVLEEKKDGRLVPSVIRNNPLEGNIFKDNSWLNMSQHIIEMHKPVSLNEEEFNKFINLSLDEREEVIDNKTVEMEANISDKDNRSPDEILEDLKAQLDSNKKETHLLDVLE